MIKNLYERSCMKCQGFLVHDLTETLEGSFRMLRCVMCGQVIDLVILTNRRRQMEGEPL